MDFQLEVDYYSNDNKNKYTNFRLKASIKSNLKIAEDEIVQGIVLATRTCHTLLLGLESTLLLGLVVTWKYIFQVQVMFLWARHNPTNIGLGEDVLKTSWRRLEDVVNTTFFLSSTMPWRRLEDVLEDEKYYAEDVFKTSSRRLGKQEMFAGKSLYIHINMTYVNKNQQGHLYCWFPSLSFIFHIYGGITLA